MPELKRLVPEELNPKLDITLVTDIKGLEKVSEYLNTIDTFVIDCESNKADDFTDRYLRTIQVGDRNKQFVIDLLPFAERARVYSLEMVMHTPYKPDNCLMPIVRMLRPFLESAKWLKVGQGLQFDYEILKYRLGIRMFNLYCTHLAEKVIYSGQVRFDAKGFWGMEDQVARYTGLLIDKDEQTGFKLEGPLTDSQITYCALDVRLPMSLKAGQRPALDEGQLWQALQIENDVLMAFGDMHLNGFLVDKKKWLKVVHRYKKAHKRNIAKLDEFFIPLVGTKDFDESGLPELERIWREDPNKETRAEARKKFMAARKIITRLKKDYKSFQGQAAINYGSPIALYKVIRELPRFVEANLAAETNRRLPSFASTGDRVLKNFAEHPTWDLAEAEEQGFDQVGMIDALRLYRETEKLLNSYGTNWLRKYVNKKTGRVHGKLNQLGADTGRSSCSVPNMQQLPRGEEWRSCFVAPKGRKIITCDLSGAELVILAELSQDPIFVHAYRNGWDIHSVVAEIVFGDEWKDGAGENCAYYKDGGHKKCSCKPHKKLRNKAKPVGLGMAYGMEAQKLADQIGVTFEEAQKIIDTFRAEFPVLIEYLTKSGNETKEKLESRTLAMRRRLFQKPLYKHGVLRAKARLEKKGIKKAPSPQQISWALHSLFSDIEREGKNNPLQGSNADISKLAMGCTEGMMWHRLEPEFDALLVMFVHDEVCVEVPDEHVKPCTECVESAFVGASAILIKSVPMGTETNVEQYWKK